MAGEPRLGVAVIGLSVRVAGADDERQFWQNLQAGVDSVFPLSDDQLRAAGLTEDELRQPDRVKCESYINGIDLFDGTALDVTVDSDGNTFSTTGVDLAAGAYTTATGSTIETALLRW